MGAEHEDGQGGAEHQDHLPGRSELRSRGRLAGRGLVEQVPLPGCQGRTIAEDWHLQGRPSAPARSPRSRMVNQNFMQALAVAGNSRVVAMSGSSITAAPGTLQVLKRKNLKPSQDKVTLAGGAGALGVSAVRVRALRARMSPAPTTARTGRSRSSDRLAVAAMDRDALIATLRREGITDEGGAGRDVGGAAQTVRRRRLSGEGVGEPSAADRCGSDDRNHSSWQP